MRKGTALVAATLTTFLAFTVSTLTNNVKDLQQTIQQRQISAGHVDPDLIVQATLKAMKKADQDYPDAVYQSEYVDGVVKIYWVPSYGERIELAAEPIN